MSSEHCHIVLLVAQPARQADDGLYRHLFIGTLLSQAVQIE